MWRGKKKTLVAPFFYILINFNETFSRRARDNIYICPILEIIYLLSVGDETFFFYLLLVSIKHIYTRGISCYLESLAICIKPRASLIVQQQTSYFFMIICSCVCVALIMWFLNNLFSHFTLHLCSDLDATSATITQDFISSTAYI